ncbi:NAD(P)H-dependent oxidoreductase [Tamlana sp. 2_MG-2023]|uniref:NAD(P)H-dependent oxidoreductase n=1 Tax=unclassified Tamlana TaxID=2614803 RepID=UPI0026E40CDF|nr:MULTISPECIES: NAD(P)H-dependent oxidoreductase [unclassified Tamlana]MDO6759163.1 NAD(P)H-dependent oxidoreductase [Tamlana sp. 2_MG-2023]MDO6790698.1 NAD(P)H-dependent oxidoreductase [Tamlana sp. 1_MG-2023]
MDTIKQLQWRYATKKFDVTKKLSAEKLNVVKQAFNLTATSFGLQTIKLVIIEDQTVRQSLLKASFNQRQVVDASHLLVICVQSDISTADIDNYYKNIQGIRQTSETILKPYREDLVKMMAGKSVVQRQQWSTNQAYIALGNLMTVCAVEGIDSCPMEGFLPQEYDRILELDKQGLKSVLLLPLGYRAADDMFSELKKVRRPINEAVIEI